MLHFLHIDDSFPINTRNTKILQSLAQHYGKQARISVITWDRAGDYAEPLAGYHVYQKASAYGQKIQKLRNLWGYRNMKFPYLFFIFFCTFAGENIFF